MENLTNFFVRLFDDFFVSIVILLTSSTILIIVNWYLGLLFVGLLIVNYLVILATTRRIKEQNIKIRRSVGKISNIFKMHLPIIKVSKKTNFNELLEKKILKHNDESYKNKVELSKKITRYRGLSNISRYTINIVPILLGIFLVYYNKLNLSGLITFILYIGYANTPIYKLLNFFEQRQKFNAFYSNINSSKWNATNKLSNIGAKNKYTNYRYRLTSVI